MRLSVKGTVNYSGVYKNVGLKTEFCEEMELQVRKF
jgi:hypothetical protein